MITTGTEPNRELIISADSHVVELLDMWERALPQRFLDIDVNWFPVQMGQGDYTRSGGWDPTQRLKDMAMDGVSAEVIYPTQGLKLFGLEDGEIQEAYFRVYNDWLIEYCQSAPERRRLHDDVVMRRLQRRGAGAMLALQPGAVDQPAGHQHDRHQTEQGGSRESGEDAGSSHRWGG